MSQPTPPDSNQPSPLMPLYAAQPVAFVRGDGVWLYDSNGRRYLDCLAGIAVNTLGHRHPKLVAALSEQVDTSIHMSNLFQSPWQAEVARRLVDRAHMTNAFFCNSGLEANEAALKLARLHGHNRGIETPHIIVFEHAFHGRSIATLSATGNAKVQKGFEPLVPGFIRVPTNDIEAIRAVASRDNEVAAVFLEPIQGEGGIDVSRNDYLRALRELCTEKGWLLMFDEVQCGMGRTGKWFEHQWAGVVPDVMTLAKGLGSGVPVGALLAHGQAATTFKAGNHGTTFGGNPLAMCAARVTIDCIEAEGLLDNAATIGTYIRDSFEQRLRGVNGFVEMRGLGLMIGIKFDRPCGALVGQALEAGLVLNVTAESVVRLLPPLIFQREHADHLLDTLIPVIQRFLAQPAAA